MENFIDNQAADDVLNELTQSQSDVQSYDEDATESIMEQAVMRIEEANLFKLLINAEVFAENSARPEIMNSVKSKLRQFAIKELEELLGMRKIAEPVILQQKDFDAQEVHALKIVASKVLKRDPPSEEAAPALVPVASTPVSPQIKQVQGPSKSQAAPVPMPKKPVPQVSKKNITGSRTKVPDFSTVDKGFALPAGGQQKKAMPTVEQAMAGMGMSRPNITLGEDAKNGDVQGTQNLLGNILQSLTGGHMIHVDSSAPADTIQGDDVNGRF